MPGQISDLIPEDLCPESEAKIRELVKRKMKGACGMLVRVLRILEEHYGPEVKQLVHDQLMRRKPRPAEQRGPAADDLRVFCDALDRGCVGSHEWERTIDEPDRVGYSFTSCLWAEIFNELDAADIGWWWCEGDEPSVKAYHPELGFRRAKTLMEGHDECDHIFLVEK